MINEYKNFPVPSVSKNKCIPGLAESILYHEFINMKLKIVTPEIQYKKSATIRICKEYPSACCGEIYFLCKYYDFINRVILSTNFREIIVLMKK